MVQVVPRSFIAPYLSPGVTSMSAVPRLRERLREQTQQAILDAASRILADEGVALARIDAIAAEAGVSGGTLYNYYGDREGLVKIGRAHV